jgi:hypothetical protein
VVLVRPVPVPQTNYLPTWHPISFPRHQ